MPHHAAGESIGAITGRCTCNACSQVKVRTDEASQPTALKRPRAAPPLAVPRRLLGFSCRHVVGPMVGASDLAFRLLCRRHGADTCYTEMLFSSRLVDDPSYRARKLRTCAEDRPLIVQLQGSEPAQVGAAAALVEATCACDAIDLNLGCPLPQAHEERFGAFLLDREHWPTVAACIQAMVHATALPICAKIRLLPSVDETIDLVRMLHTAGCAMVAVHGRRRPPIGQHRGERLKQSADLDAVRQVCAACGRAGGCSGANGNAAGDGQGAMDDGRLHVLTNGNTQLASDVSANLAHTHADGLMAAEGVLRNPRLFKHAAAHSAPSSTDCPHFGARALVDGMAVSGALSLERSPPSLELSRDDVGSIALEYLALARDEEISVVRSHVMWLLGKSGKGERCRFEWLGPFSDVQLRMALVGAESVDELEGLVRAVLGLATV